MDLEPRTDLSAKVALVTGAAGGLGRAIAATLLDRGAKICVTDIDPSGLKELSEELGDGHLAIHADISSAAEAKRVVEETAFHFGAFDVLINNAAVIIAKSVVDCTEKEFDRVMAVNVKAPFFTTQVAIHHMRKAGGGSVVNIGSISSLVGLREQSVYCASKGGLLQLTRQVAVDYAREGIRCNIVCPGTIQTSLLDRFLSSSSDPDATRESLMSGHPIGRFADPQEVAEVVAFLASDASSFMHGSVVSVDGGYVTH